MLRQKPCQPLKLIPGGVTKCVPRLASLMLVLVGCGLAALALANGAIAVLAGGPTFTTIEFPGAVASVGTDINDSGQIVGEDTFIDLNHKQGFLFSNADFTSISFPVDVLTPTTSIN